MKDSSDDSENSLNEPSLSSLWDISESSELIKRFIFFLFLNLETILHENENFFNPRLNKKIFKKNLKKKMMHPCIRI